MKASTGFLLRHRKATIVVFAVLVAISCVLFFAIQVNYDLAKYLPDSSMTRRAIDEMEQSFGYEGTVQVMVEGVSVAQALDAKARMEAVEGVKSVLWLSDVADLTQPLEALDPDTLAAYYKDGAALFSLTFDAFDYAPSTGTAIEAIRELDIENMYIAGAAEESRNMKATLSREIGQVLLIIVPICLLILFLTTDTWIEPPLYLLVLLVSILLNMGTNAFFQDVSFITHAMATVLQLAISLDYSLFLFHRYLEERDRGKEAWEAVVAASAKSLRSILSSALTTVAGFLALVFMQYSIGRDIGLVLAKGIMLSLITVMTLMPVLIYLLRNVIEKTRHRHFMPSFAKLGRAAMKIRWPLIILLVVVSIPAFLGQSSNEFLYGDNAGSAQGDTLADRSAIQARFGVYNPVVLLVPVGDVAQEAALSEGLAALPGVSGVQALVTLADPALPRDMLPDSIRGQFESARYSRMIINLAQDGENEATTQAVRDLYEVAEANYPGEWLAAGTATSYQDIRQSVEVDNSRVQLVSILAVALIVLVAFRSITIPILLVLIIECAIWINMAASYFSGSPLVYIGYLIISSIQLGATIDYAILMTTRYMESRRTRPPKEAAIAALSKAGPSVVVSALVLSVAGFCEALLSSVPSISEIGLLLGRGALLSGLLVLVVLPPLLAMTDPLIRLGTLKAKGEKK